MTKLENWGWGEKIMEIGAETCRKIGKMWARGEKSMEMG